MSDKCQNPTRALQQTAWPSTFAVSRLMTSLEFSRLLDGISSGLEPRRIERPGAETVRQKRRRSKGLKTLGPALPLE
jgi:hypothetical protein